MNQGRDIREPAREIHALLQLKLRDELEEARAMLARAREILARNDEIHPREISGHKARRTQELSLSFEMVKLSHRPDEQALLCNTEAAAKDGGVCVAHRFIKTPDINAVRDDNDFVCGEYLLRL